MTEQAYVSCPTSVTRHVAAHLEQLDEDAVTECAAAVAAAVARGAYIYSAGNGGSATTASHLACDLTNERTQVRGRAPRVRALFDPGVTTALANDFGYDQVFVAPLRPVLEQGDLLIVISVSGSSPNVLRALELGRERRAVNVALLGTDGGGALALSDACVLVPCDDFGVVESVHLAVAHEISARVRAWDGRPDA